MPKGVTYSQSQYDQGEAIADALKNSGGIPVNGGGGDASSENQEREIEALGDINEPPGSYDSPASIIRLLKRLQGVCGSDTPQDDNRLSIQESLHQLFLCIHQNKIKVEGNRPNITIISGTLNTSGDTTLVAAPGAGVSINIAYLKVQLEASTATTVIIKSGANTKERVLCASQGDGLVLNFPPNRELQLDANTALVLNLSGANSVNYTFHYFTS